MLLKGDGLSEMLISIPWHHCMFLGHLHSKMVYSFVLVYKPVNKLFLLEYKFSARTK